MLEYAFMGIKTVKPLALLLLVGTGLSAQGLTVTEAIRWAWHT
jgi:hypothetical protein